MVVAAVVEKFAYLAKVCAVADEVPDADPQNRPSLRMIVKEPLP